MVYLSMKFIELKWDGIALGNVEESPYTLVFITKQMFRDSLLNSLGHNLEIEFVEKNNGDVYLTVKMLDNDTYTVYNTGYTIEGFPDLIHLKNHNTSAWSVGHREDGNILYHLPVRHLTS